MRIKLTPDEDIRVRKVRVGNVPVLVLKPAKPAERSATDVGFLWIHGGGYILGMKEMAYMSRAADLVRRYGVTVYSPGYRLAWLKPYPAAVEDCCRVLEYVAGKEETLMVGGESAGRINTWSGSGLLLRHLGRESGRAWPGFPRPRSWCRS